MQKGTKVLILAPSGYNLGRLHVDELYGVVQRTKEGKAELFLYFAEEPHAGKPATLAAVAEPIPSNIKEAREEQKKVMVGGSQSTGYEKLSKEGVCKLF